MNALRTLTIALCIFFAIVQLTVGVDPQPRQDGGSASGSSNGGSASGSSNGGSASGSSNGGSASSSSSCTGPRGEDGNCVPASSCNGDDDMSYIEEGCNGNLVCCFRE